MKKVKEKKFTGYDVFMIAVLTFIQFTIILDFMVMSPVKPMLTIDVTPAQFAMVVSAYAFSAGISGFLAAGFADKFDRKKMLLFFYTGFVLGTFLCGIANSYSFLLGARIITGIFGGVIGSISLAIITDLFKLEVRGTVMGFIQTSFAASQVLGLPIGLFFAERFGWHAPFLMIVGVCVVVGVVILIYMKPVNAHLLVKSDRNAFVHLKHTISNRTYLKAFAAMALLATGGFMLMPFGADFTVHNLGLPTDQLPFFYGITGVFAIFTGPLIGKLSDKVGKYQLFVVGSIVTIIMVILYCNLDVTPFAILVSINVVMFVGISSRIISSSALMTAVPELKDRGAFMSINSSIQQISGGIAAICAGLIVTQRPDKTFVNYPILGYVVAASIIITIILIYPLNQYVTRKLATAKPATGSASGAVVVES